MQNVPDDWNQYWVTCPFCEKRYHASEGGCECAGPSVYCDHCAELIGHQDDEIETRDGFQLCEACAKEYDETCENCGDIRAVCGCDHSQAKKK